MSEEKKQFNLEAIKDLVKIINESNLEQLEYDCGDFSLKLTKNNNQNKAKSIKEQIISIEKAEEIQPPEIKKEEIFITSPMVGRIYTSAKPDAPSFIKEGDKIEKNQAIFIIEAMKVMNQMKSDKAGVVKKILIKDGQPVEFGQKLVLIEE